MLRSYTNTKCKDNTHTCIYYTLIKDDKNVEINVLQIRKYI